MFQGIEVMFESLRSEAVISWLILPVLELEGEMQDKFRQRDGLNFFFFFFFNCLVSTGLPLQGTDLHLYFPHNGGTWFQVLFPR